MSQPLAERFWARVDSSGGPDACWPWKLSCRRDGYGQIRVAGCCVAAHRLAYELAVGPIPDGTGFHGAVVMHTCDNRKCCNPAHLHLGSQYDNLRDMYNKGRARPGGRPYLAFAEFAAPRS